MTCQHPAYHWQVINYQGSPCFSLYTVGPVCSDAQESNAQVIDTHKGAHTDAAYKQNPCETFTGSKNNGAQSELNRSKLKSEKEGEGERLISKKSWQKRKTEEEGLIKVDLNSDN